MINKIIANILLSTAYDELLSDSRSLDNADIDEIANDLRDLLRNDLFDSIIPSTFISLFSDELIAEMTDYIIDNAHDIANEMRNSLQIY